MINMAKILTVNCPCCGKILEVDAISGEVLGTREKKKFASLEDFMEKEKQRPKELESMFEAAKEKEKYRKEMLEEKFEAAKARKDLKDPPPTIQWD